MSRDRSSGIYHRRKGATERVDQGRQWMGKLVPTGAATMSDEEFRAKLFGSAPGIDDVCSTVGAKAGQSPRRMR